MKNPILDQSSIEIEEDFQSNKQVVFNQFMGLLTEVTPIKYTVELHGTNDILRTFEIGNSIKNNVQLVFRGQLLDDPRYTAGFQIIKMKIGMTAQPSIFNQNINFHTNGELNYLVQLFLFGNDLLN